MNSKKFVCLILAVLNLICASVLLVSANPTAPAESQPVVTSPTTVTAPVVTTDPYGMTTPSGSGVDPSVPVSSALPSGTDTSVPTEPTEPVTTVPVTRPTEIASDPGYTSDYVAQPPAYQPGEHDVQKQEWDELKEDDIIKDADKQLSVSGSKGNGSFGYIKDNTSKGDEKSNLLVILSFVCWFIALALVTFAILYRPDKKAVKAVATDEEESDVKEEKHTSDKYASKRRSTSVKLSEDDYNDGF
ncbi:MAG: hypothetical protein IKJ83_03635 [Ruminococcus sp.]|nr:hypothetical protein [Ruminococcus sp.]